MVREFTHAVCPGHEYALNCQKEAGDMEFEWMRTYGPTWRIRGNFGVSRTLRVYSFSRLLVLNHPITDWVDSYYHDRRS